MASEDTSQTSNTTDNQGESTSVGVSQSYLGQAAGAVYKRVGGALAWSVRGLGYNQDKPETDETGESDMASRSEQSSGQTRFATRDTEGGFVDVNVKKDSDDDGDTALGQALEELEKLRKMQTSNLRKISELEKKVKQKDAELQTFKQQVSSGPQKPTSTHQPKGEIVDSESVKEKDRKIRQLQRQLEHTTDFEKRVTQLTLELSQKEEELNQLKAAINNDKSGTKRGQVQMSVADYQHMQAQSAESEKIREHSKKQSRQVLLLRQELDGQKIEFGERIQSLEGVIEDLEREKQQFFEQSKRLRAEQDQLLKTKEQLKKEMATMKEKYQLLEAQHDDESTCQKHKCKEFRKKYNELTVENSQLRQKLISLGKISEQLSAREVTVGEQKIIITNLMEKVAVAQTQAVSNQADFEEERRDRMKAHSKFADLENEAAKTKSHFEQERAAYEQRIQELEQDLSSVKEQLQTHIQELLHLEEYSKRHGQQLKEVTQEKARLEKELSKRKDAKAAGKSDSEYKQLKSENERLKAKLSEAKKSVTYMSGEMKKDKKGIKKLNEELTKRIKKLKTPQKSSEEPTGCKLTEANALVDMLLSKIQQLEEKVHHLTVANDEMTKMLTIDAKPTQQPSFDVPMEDSQPSSELLFEDRFSSLDKYNRSRGASRTEEHTAGTGHVAATSKQASKTTSNLLPSTFATQDQLSPLPSSNSHLSTKEAAYKGGDYRRGSDPALVAHSQSSSSTLPTNTNQPSMLRAKSNPGPQQSTGSSKQPIRAVAPQPPTTNPNISEDMQHGSGGTKQPVRATAPPPAVHISVQSFQRPTSPHGQGQQPQRQAVENLQPQRVKYPPKMHSEKQQRDAETGQNVKQRPVHSQPQPQQQFGQSSQKCQGNFRGISGQQLQPASQERSYSEHQPGHSDAMYPPETQHTPHSHPIGANQHSSARPPVTKPPGSNVSGRGTAQPYDPRFRNQPLPPQGASPQHDTHGNQSQFPINAHQGSGGSGQHPPTQEPSGDYSTYVNVGNVLPPKQSLGHQKLPQGKQNPTVSPEPPSSVASLVQPAADQHSNKLSVDIDDDIEDTADEVREQVSGGRERTVTNVAKPFDPNLTCPMCNKCFRIGEIQRFRHHVKSCEGTKNEGTVV